MGGRIAILLALALCCCSCDGTSIPVQRATTQVVSIPLDQIWAYRMPGTRDIERLEPKFFTKEFVSQSGGEIGRQIEGSLVRKIRKALAEVPQGGPKPGFAVEGSGVDALSRAYEMLSGAEHVQDEFVAGGDISLFFFSYQAGSYVHLKSVERTEKTFLIRFEHVPHMTLDMSEHFALIPAGDLSPGKYQVSVNWYDSNGKLVASKDRFACQSFSFVVSEHPKE